MGGWVGGRPRRSRTGCGKGGTRRGLIRMYACLCDAGGTWADSAGSVSVAELDWFKPEQVAPLQPPFDYLLAADCIYHEHIVEHFHRMVMMLTTDKSIGEPACGQRASVRFNARLSCMPRATRNLDAYAYACACTRPCGVRARLGRMDMVCSSMVIQPAAHMPCHAVPRGAVAVCNELRSHSVHARFMELFSASHTIKVVPRAKLHDVYQHPNINIFVMRKKKPKGSGKGRGDGSDDEDADADDGDGDGDAAAVLAPAQPSTSAASAPSGSAGQPASSTAEASDAQAGPQLSAPAVGASGAEDGGGEGRSGSGSGASPVDGCSAGASGNEPPVPDASLSHASLDSAGTGVPVDGLATQVAGCSLSVGPGGSRDTA